MTRGRRQWLDDRWDGQGFVLAARALRALADYLERNPNALLFGKGGDRR